MGLRNNDPVTGDGPTRESITDISARFTTAPEREVPEDIDERVKLFAQLADEIEETAQRFNHKVTDSPNKTHALRMFEDALMWAGKAIFE